MSIELRLSNTPPPTPESSRTIYRDIESLPDPMILGLTIRAYNYDDVGLYFKITGSATGYTFTPVTLGLIASGANLKQNLDAFASRARPAVETEEAITLTLLAYTDAGYVNLKHTFNRSVTVVIINSQDGSWTLDELDDFDDGTVQGWAVSCIYGCDAGYPILQVVADFVLSAPNSIRGGTQTSSLAYNSTFKLYKSFTTPDKNKVFAVFNVRLRRSNTDAFINCLRKMRDTTILVQIGGYWATATDKRYENLAPLDKWMRVVVPLPRDTTLEVSIQSQWSFVGKPSVGYVYQDDFKIISKD